jgi:hypothetical protein
MMSPTLITIPSEILNQIFSDVQHSASKKQVLNVALSCKALLPYGLQIIWTELHSLVPLLNTLPSDLWRKARVPIPQSIQEKRSPVDTAECSFDCIVSSI